MQDPIEKIIENALIMSGIRYKGGREGHNPSNLDFALLDYDVEIEVKQFHSDRISAQMAKAPNVIAIQGRSAALCFASLINGKPKDPK